MLKKLAFIFLTIVIITSFNVFADEGNVTTTSTTVDSSTAVAGNADAATTTTTTTGAPAAENNTTSATTTAATSTTVEGASAGVSPDSFVYSLDKLIEKIQLFLIKDSVKQAELLAKIAQERLAESKEMMEQNKTDLAEKALIEYKDTMDKAIDNIDTAMAAGKEVSKVASQIATDGMKNTEIVNAIIEKTPEQYKEQVKQAIAKIVENAEITHEVSTVVDAKEDDASNPIKREFEKNIIEAKVTDKAVIDKMKQENLNLRQMAAIISLAEQTKKPVSEVLDAFLANGKGIGVTAQALGVAPKDALKGINRTFKQAKSELKQVYKSAAVEKEEDDKDVKETEDEDRDDTASKAPVDTITSASTTAAVSTTDASVSGSEAKLQQKLKEAKQRINEIKGEDKSKEKLEKRIEKAKEKQEKFEKHKKKERNEDKDNQEEDKDDEHEGSDD